MELNYFGTLYPVRAVVPSMIERRQGHLMLVSSAAGIVGVYGYSAYAPAKFAVRGLAETLRAELKPHGIVVGCAYPPDIDTPGLEAEDAHEARGDAHALGACEGPPARRRGEGDRAWHRARPSDA